MSKTFRALERAELERKSASGRREGEAPDDASTVGLPSAEFQRQAILFERTALGRIRTSHPVIELCALGDGDLEVRWAVSVGATLAEQCRREVLIVDAAFEKPLLHRLLGITSAGGAVRVCDGHEGIVRKAGIEASSRQISLLTAGEVDGYLPDPAAVERLGEWIRRQSRGFDWTWVLSGGGAGLTRLAGLSGWSDGTVLILTGETTPAAASAAVRSAERHGRKVVGCVYLSEDGTGGVVDSE